MHLSKPFPLPVVVVAAAIILSASVYFQRGDTVSGVYANAFCPLKPRPLYRNSVIWPSFAILPRMSQLWWTRIICLLRRHASRIWKLPGIPPKRA